MAERVIAPAAAVAECPEGKELEEGVFIRGAISVLYIKGRARLNRDFTPSASVQETATAVHGTSRWKGSSPLTRKPRAASMPHKAPAVPATVKLRISDVNGTHLKQKIARNSARSRSLILSTTLFKSLVSPSRKGLGCRILHLSRRNTPLYPTRRGVKPQYYGLRTLFASLCRNPFSAQSPVAPTLGIQGRFWCKATVGNEREQEVQP